MPKREFESVDEYLEAQPASARAVLASVRSVIRRAMPRAEEGISYHMPTYRLDGQSVLHFAAWKRHYSLYPVTPAVVAALGREASKYEIEKGTIRFEWTERVPAALIARIAKARAKECADSASPKRASRKKGEALLSKRRATKKSPISSLAGQSYFAPESS